MEWTGDLAVGINKIDEQHRELFKRINDLLLAIREQRCRAEIDKTIEFLDDYARFHFSEEEQRMGRPDTKAFRSRSASMPST